ncbi:hypothetical protein CYMTET_56109, partial [Cymbomonas tetramitiformis]
IFAINQHEHSKSHALDDMNNTVHAIKEADRAVVSVGRNLSAFKNIWSMYTTFNLLQHKKKIEMLLASNITFDDFSKATENIDLPKCQGGRGNNWQEQQTEKQLLLADIDNLGKGYKKAAQKIKEGLMNTTQSEVERVKELHGEMDLRTAFALTQHGNLLEKTGKLEEAEKAYQQALVIDETLLGPKHVQLTSTLGYLAELYSKMKSWKSTFTAKGFRPVMREAAEGAEACGRGRRRGVMAREAVRVHRRALDIWEQECGEQDVRVIRSLNNFALLLKNAGQQREATAGFERGLDILDNKGLGEELPSDLLALLNNHAGMLMELQDYAQAEQHYRRMLDIMRNIGEANNSSQTLKLKKSLGNACSSQDKFAEAKELFLQILEVQEAAEEQRLDRAETMVDIGLACSDLGDFENAAEYLEKALAIREDSPDVKDSESEHHAAALGRIADTFVAMSMLSRKQSAKVPAENVSERQSKYDQAMEQLGQAMQIREHLLAEGAKPDVAIADLKNEMGLLLEMQDKLQEAEPLRKAACEIWQQNLGPEHPRVATGLNNLAALLTKLGKFDLALPLYQRCLELEEANLGKDNPSMAPAMNNLALLFKTLVRSHPLTALQDPGACPPLTALQDLSRHEEAYPLYKRSLELCEAELGEQHPTTASALYNLGSLHMDLHRWPSAMECLSRCTKIREEVLGPNDVDVAATLRKVATVAMATKDFQRAEAALKRALSIYSAKHGEQCPEASAIQASMSELYIAMGRSEEALEVAALELERVIHKDGPNSAEAAKVMSRMACLHIAQGHLEDAKALIHQAADIQKQVLDCRGPDQAADIQEQVAVSLNNLAGVLKEQGHYDEAVPYYKECIKIRSKLDGNHDVETVELAANLNNLAEVFRSQGRFKEAGPLLKKAEPLYQRALSIRREKYGAQHPEVAETLTNLAGVYSSQQQFDAAVKAAQEALDINEALVGRHSKQGLGSLKWLAHVYYSQGDYDTALVLMQEVATAEEMLLGVNHPELAKTLNNLAGIYAGKHQFEEVLELYKRSLTMLEVELGSHHPDVAKTLHNLGVVFYKNGKAEMAVPVFERAVAIQIDMYGPENPSTKSTQAWLWRAQNGPPPPGVVPPTDPDATDEPFSPPAKVAPAPEASAVDAPPATSEGCE